ncbi:ATP-binding cassette domain-containing protein, partial [Gemmatimonas aurantiaca]|nr:ATP-binding cassette domain-containing protein [Gemmatimonas aurantiaca]
SFSYANTREGERKQQLLNISLTVQAGESIGIIGPVGSGKSTLAALIPRMYVPPRGTLFIDDRDVCDWSLNALRTQIGFVPQESFLFSDKLDANIRFGFERASDELTMQASKLAALDKDVRDFRDGYKTIVGERGITLSGGQKQRMSIARALLIDPSIIVFDDATSALDTETDAQIKSGLRETLKGRTSIIISHRISSIQNCDRIYYLDSGRITESGSHSALVQSGGAYAELSRMQSLEHDLEQA